MSREHCMLCNKEIKENDILKDNIIITQCFHHFHLACFMHHIRCNQSLCPCCLIHLSIPKNNGSNAKECVRQLKLLSCPKQL